MPILQIQHSVSDFDAWKRVFDSDPIGREAGGVRRYRILRLTDDPNYVVVNLEFDSSGEAESFRTALQKMWRRVEAEGLVEAPRALILDPVESKEY